MSLATRVLLRIALNPFGFEKSWLSSIFFFSFWAWKFLFPVWLRSKQTQIKPHIPDLLLLTSNTDSPRLLLHHVSLSFLEQFHFWVGASVCVLCVWRGNQLGRGRLVNFVLLLTLLKKKKIKLWNFWSLHAGPCFQLLLPLSTEDFLESSQNLHVWEGEGIPGLFWLLPKQHVQGLE